MHRLEFHAMGCKMLAMVEREAPAPILQDVPAWFEEWEQVLSRFRSDSELSLLNLNDGFPFSVSQTLWDMFQASLDADGLTGSLVNPLVLPALIQAGYDRSFEQYQTGSLSFASDHWQDSSGLSFALACPGSAVPALRNVVADAQTRTICIPKGALLDFGGVAKGWAAGQAVERLQGFGPALVSAGGDIAVSGPLSDGEAWSIGVEDPFQPGSYLETIYLEHGGVATSGRDYRRWTRGGQAQHHIIDPRIGLPAKTDILTATVIAPTVMAAEALAKAVLISGSHAGLAWLDSDKDWAGLLVLENGQRLYSRQLEQYL